MPVQLQCNFIVEVFPEERFGELWYHQSKPLLCVQEQQCASWCFAPPLTTTSVLINVPTLLLDVQHASVL